MNILIVDDEAWARRDLSIVVRGILNNARIDEAGSVDETLAMCRDTHYDVIFLDIQMPETDGLQIAERINEITPECNIVMVTAYPQYALSAHKLYVSGYILKPAMEDDVREVLEHLRYPVELLEDTDKEEEQKSVYAHCFGNFEIFYKGTPIKFARAQSKEMLAYLIDRQGAVCTNAEIRAVLWQDEEWDSLKQRDLFSHVTRALRESLKRVGCEYIYSQSRNAYSVRPETFSCDYYRAITGDKQAIKGFLGEYMSQYSWAESTAAELYQRFYTLS